MCKNEENTMILTEIPKHESGNNKGRVKWSKTIGMDIEILYIGEQYTVNVVDYENNYITLKYNSNNYKIHTGNFMACKFAKIFGVRTDEFRYKIGDVVCDDLRDFTVTDAFMDNRSSKRQYKYYKVKCNRCGYEDVLIEHNIKAGRKCRACSEISKIVVYGINSIYDTHKEYVKYFLNKEDAKTNSRGSNKKVNFKCPDCGSIKKMQVDTLISQGLRCNICSDGLSYPNKFGRNMLLELSKIYNIKNIKFEYSSEWSNGAYYDIYFMYNEKQYIVEMDGAFHYTDNIMSGMTESDAKSIDDTKDKLALQNGIKVIRIDCNYGNYIDTRFDYIRKNVIESCLSNVFDFNTFNWSNVKNKCYKSLILESWRLWDEGLETKQISEHLKLEISTIQKYLREGSKLGVLNRTRTVTTRNEIQG